MQNICGIAWQKSKMDLHRILVVSFLFVIRPGQQQQQCSIDSLPPFGHSGNDKPDRDRFQGIVPAYTFQCSGRYRVTEWMACVQRHSVSDQYYIQFQVWRPNGCYSLVGYNHPLDNNGMESYLVAINDNNSPLEDCVVLTVEEDEQIEVQSGDVVGYYVDHFRAGDNDRDDNGIQWIEGYNDVVVYYEDDLPRESIKSHYGIGVNPTECDFELPANEDTNSYSISWSTSAAPIISFSIATIIPTSPPPTSLPDISPPLLTTASIIPSVPPVSAPSQTVDSSPSNPPNATQSTDRTGLIIGIVLIIIIFVIVIAVGGIIIVLIIRKRRIATKPLGVVSYQETVNNTHDSEIKTDTNEAYHSVNNNVITTTNPAYITTTTVTVPDQTEASALDNETSTYYEGTGISISQNPSYTATNVSESDAVDTSPNVAYKGTDITTSDNPAYVPTQDSSENTLEYDYI